MLVPDPATVYCGQRYNLKAKLPGGGKFWKKTQKVMLKYVLAKENTAHNKTKAAENGPEKLVEKSR